jgi:hypothetical protein
MEPATAAVGQPDLRGKKLGEITVNREAFDLDLKINEGYQSFSAELLRLALLVLTGISAVWLKVYLPADGHATVTSLVTKIAFISSFAATIVAAGAALLHRYTAPDSLAYQLTALRRRARNRPAEGDRPSDVTLAERNERARDKRFKWSGFLLGCSAAFLFIGLLLFCSALGTLMF